MTDDERTTEPPFLKRWSQRKLAASRESAAPPNTVAAVVPNPPPAVESSARASPAALANTTAPTLPPVESLSFDSDFTAFLQPNVDETLKRDALRKLFRDPRFNVMDGLDVYIDDYGKFEPIAPEIIAQLNQARYLFDPPKTRVNEHGHVEDVPDEPGEETSAETAEEAPPLEAAPASIVDKTTNSPLADSAVPSLPPAPEETR